MAVRPLPMVEMNWAVQSSAKSRLRNTANGEGRDVPVAMDIGSLLLTGRQLTTCAG